MPQLLTEEFKKEWKSVVEEDYAGQPAIKDPSMRSAVYTCLNNTISELNEATVTGDMAQYTPVLMSLIRRTLPTLVGPELVGLQPMNLPTGRIFVQHVTGGGSEIWKEGTIGTATAAGTAPNPVLSGPYTTPNGENLGWKGQAADTGTGATVQQFVTPGTPWPEMSFTITSVDVNVKTRALKGKITTEVISDLKAVHGLDAEQEIANLLQTEITAEIDREIVARIYSEAKQGAQNCNNVGDFNFAADADGRWSMEKVQGLLIQIEREATLIAQETRRGRGNFILTSPEMAAYLSMANLITTDYNSSAGFSGLVNPVGVSFYGVLANRFKVYVDPYLMSTNVASVIRHQMIVGYKGANAYDAGLFYCPYIPIQFFKATGEEDFGMRLGIKSRYGLASNPYYIASGQDATAATNSYFRKFSVIVD